MKIYFCQYGGVISMKAEDAISLCQDAIANDFWDLTGYKSSKVLKRKNDLAKGFGFYSGKKYINVNHCLDWGKEEWEDLLKDLKK